MTTADESYQFSGLFEAELLLELMLRYWDHPLADDREFRNELIERASEVLLRSRKGERLLLDVPPYQMNFIAAIWHAESLMVGDDAAGNEPKSSERLAWLDTVRRVLPSCFCDPGDLPD